MLLNSLLGTTWYPITFDSPLNIARGVFFWIAVAFFLAVIVGAIAAKKGTRKKFLLVCLFLGVCYACLVGLVLLVLSFAEDGIAALLFYPLLVLILCIAASAVALYFFPSKVTLIVTGCVTGAAAVAVLVCMGFLYASGDSLLSNWIYDDNGDPDFSKVSQLGLYLSAGALIVALIAATFLLGRKEKKGFDSKSIVYAAVCIAMSFALSYLRIVKMPQDGSITIASLVPLMIYSYMFGVKKGVFAGLIYGILQAFQSPTILHPAQFLLDYPVPFACIGFAGVFAKIKKLDKLPQIQIALGGVVAGLARFLSHYLSGCFAFGSFAPEGQPVWIYSLGYQAAYVLPDIAIAIAVAVALFSSRALVRQLRESGEVFETPEPAAEKTEPVAEIPTAGPIAVAEAAPAETVSPAEPAETDRSDE